MNKFFEYIRNNLLYFFAYILFIVEVLYSLRTQYLWEDESFTLHLINHSFTNIIKLTSMDVHPFLYYFIIKVFVRNISNIYIKIFILRLISALPYLILLLIGNFYIKKYFSVSISKYFMLFIVTMPLLGDNIYQVRMYGWSVLFTTVFYILFILAYKKNNNFKSFIFISLFSILSAYTHYYALMVTAILYILFLIAFIFEKKKKKYLIMSIAIDIFLYLPWLNIMLKQSNKVSKTWMNHLKLRTIIRVILEIFLPSYKTNNIYLLILYFIPVFFILILGLIILQNKFFKDKIVIIGIISPFLLILFGSIFSMIINQSILNSRYITPAMGIFWLSFAIILDKLNNHHSIIKYMLIILILSIGIISYTKRISEIKNISNQFNKTIMIFNKIPRNSKIIYNNSIAMDSSSSYLKYNYGMINELPPVYSNVFNNIHKINHINIYSKERNVYFIDTNKTYNNLTYEFDKIKNKKKIGIIYLPLDCNKSAIYKLK